jgi:KRAB domain-containing zinc finger protein
MRQSILAAGVAAAVGFSGGAMAQQTAAQGGGAQGQMPELTDEQRQLMEEMRSVQQELQQTQQKLQQMEQQAYEDNPELGQQRQALQDKIAEKMSDDDYDAEKEFEQMKATVQRFQGGDQEPTKEEIQAFRQRQQEFQQRQRQAFEDPEVQEMANSLRSDVESEMKANNPEAEQLFDQMDEKAARMRQLREKAMQMQQGQGG